MLDRRLIREEPEKVKKAIESRCVPHSIDKVVALDKELLENIKKSDALKHERNVKSEEIAVKKRAGDDASELHAYMKNISGQIKEMETQQKELRDELTDLLMRIPNIPHETTPIGQGPEDNVVVRTEGEVPEPYFDVLPHWDIGEKLGLLDLEAGRRVSGRGFIVLTGDGALLSRALANLMLDIHREQGYTEVTAPYMVTEESMKGTGQLPNLADDMYHCEVDNLYLIPTSEVSITNLHSNMTIEREHLPIKYTSFSPCFRREAGSHGADTRGLLRVHQFDKVEMVKIVHPDTSYDEHESLLADACSVIDALELPYRILALCTADMGFAAAKCYDLEVYSPGVKKWLEVSSCSNFESFQARRAGIRLKKSSEDAHRYAHTLNGSGLALPRIIAAIFEHHQLPTGRIKIPQKLVPYMGGKEYLG